MAKFPFDPYDKSDAEKAAAIQRGLGINQVKFEFDERSLKALEPCEIDATITVGKDTIFIPRGRSVADELVRVNHYNAEIVNSQVRLQNQINAEYEKLTRTSRNEALEEAAQVLTDIWASIRFGDDEFKMGEKHAYEEAADVVRALKEKP